MIGEFGAVVLREGAAQFLRHFLEPVLKGLSDGVRLFILQPGQQSKARDAFLGDEDVIAFIAEHEEIGFPVSWFAPGLDMLWSLADADAVLDMSGGASAFAAPASPF